MPVIPRVRNPNTLIFALVSKPWSLVLLHTFTDVTVLEPPVEGLGQTFWYDTGVGSSGRQLRISEPSGSTVCRTHNVLT